MTDSTSTDKIQTKPSKILFGVTLTRAFLATLLGVALIFYPDKIRSTMLNFMGMFWLMSGIMGLRWGLRGEHPGRLPVITGVIGVLAGAMVLGRNLARGLLSEFLVIVLLGSIILLTGIIHVWDGFPSVSEGRRQRSWISMMIGVFEIVLGGVVLYTPLDFGPGVYWAATIWAVAGGILLFSQSLILWRQMSKTTNDDLQAELSNSELG